MGEPERTVTYQEAIAVHIETPKTEAPVIINTREDRCEHEQFVDTNYQFPTGSHSARPRASIGFVKIDSTLHAVPAGEAAQVRCDETLPKDAEQIQFNTGVVMSVGNGTQAKTVCGAKHQLIGVDLAYGNSMFDTSKAPEKFRHLKIRTPTAEIEDRGTVFTVATTSTLALVFVWNDSVMVKPVPEKANAKDPGAKEVQQNTGVFIHDGEVEALNLEQGVKDTLLKANILKVSIDPLPSLKLQKRTPFKGSVKLDFQGKKFKIIFAEAIANGDFQSVNPLELATSPSDQYQALMEVITDPEEVKVEKLPPDLNSYRAITDDLDWNWRLTALKHSTAVVTVETRVKVLIRSSFTSSPRDWVDLNPFQKDPRTVYVSWSWTGLQTSVKAIIATITGLPIIGLLCKAIFKNAFKQKVYPSLRAALAKAGINLPEEMPEENDSEKEKEKEKGEGTEGRPEPGDGNKQETENASKADGTAS
jgi:hypothetical protein